MARTPICEDAGSRKETDFKASRHCASSFASLCKTASLSDCLRCSEMLTKASTTTGSFPRPRWFDVSMWGRPLDTCMLDVRFREKFQDAMAVVISDQERAGLDILTHGDLHVDEDMAGRAWHHYPLQRWAGFAGT